MFAQEMNLYVNLFEKLILEARTSKEKARALKFGNNLTDDIEKTFSLTEETPYVNENLISIVDTCRVSRKRMQALIKKLA